MKIKTTILSAILIILSLTSAAAQSRGENLLDAGNQAYNNYNFLKALDYYKASLEAEITWTALDYIRDTYQQTEDLEEGVRFFKNKQDQYSRQRYTDYEAKALSCRMQLLVLLNRYEEAYNLPESYPALAKTDTVEYSRIIAATWKARKEAAYGDFNKAIATYEDIFAIMDRNDEVADWVSTWRFDAEYDFLKKGRLYDKTTPAFTHKVLVVYLKNLDVSDYDSEMGKTFRIKHTTTDRSFERTKYYFEFQKAFYKGESKGQFAIDFDYVTPDVVVKDLTYTDLDNRYARGADLTTVEPRDEFGELLYAAYSEYDTVIYIWNNGKYFSSNAVGGNAYDDIFPGQLEGPNRGRVFISTGWIDHPETRATLIHEFFHVLEECLGFGPKHAWYEENRDWVVPEFTNWDNNDGQFSYYKWRLQTLFPEFGWKNVNFRYRSPVSISEKAFETHLKGYRSVSQAERELAQEYYEKAVSGNDKKNNLEKSLNANPYHSKALYEMYKILQNERNYSEARTYLNYYMRLNDRDITAILDQATLSINMKDYDGAMDYIRQAIHKGIKPIHLWRIQGLVSSLMWWNTRPFEKGLGYINEAIKLLPADDNLYRQRGYYYFNFDYYKEALKDYNTAYSIRPNDWKTVVARGRALYYMGRTGEAEKEFEKALVNGNPDAVLAVSEHYAKYGYYKTNGAESFRYYQYAIDLADYSPYGYLYRGYYYQEDGNRQAIDDFKKAADRGSYDALDALEEYGINYTPKNIDWLATKGGEIKVAIYQADEDEDYFEQSFAVSMFGQEDFDITNITSKDIDNGMLDRFDVLIVPGGNPYEYRDPLKPGSMEKIRSFIRQGGGYFGVCAGAFFAISDDYLGIVNAQILNVDYWKRGLGDLKIRLTMEGENIISPRQDGGLEYSGGPISCRYANGTLFRPGGKPDLPEITILAHYETGFNHNGAPDIMAGLPAMLETTYGKGRIITFSPHPEYTRGLEMMVRRAVRHVARR